MQDFQIYAEKSLKNNLVSGHKQDAHENLLKVFLWDNLIAHPKDELRK